MFWFLTEEEKQTKKITSVETKFEPGPFSALFTCADKAAVKKSINYMNNKTCISSNNYWQMSCFGDVIVWRNKRFLLFFVQQKDSRGCPWKTFFILISRKGRADQQRLLWNNGFHVKTSQSAKN